MGADLMLELHDGRTKFNLGRVNYFKAQLSWELILVRAVEMLFNVDGECSRDRVDAVKEYLEEARVLGREDVIGILRENCGFVITEDV